MQFTASFAALATLVASVLAVPVQRDDAPARLIVMLKDGADKNAVLGDVGLVTVADVDEWSIVNAFVVDNTEANKAALSAHADVLKVEEDGVASIWTTQTNAPWGLGRVSSSEIVTGSVSDLTFNFTYDETAAGTGVDVYVVDTGIRTTHVALEGRATWGTTFGGYANQDGNGHGTHCAGTIGSGPYGISKNVSLIAVKVLSDGGSGAWTDVISGINYVAEQAAITGKPSIISMSLGGSAIATVDAAVEAAVASGVHVVVAAGNSNADAANFSPARAPSAITVCATTIADARASYSNYGTIVDICAPGSNVISSYGTSDTATASLSGTSMATPHVAGLVAYLISLFGNDTPANIADLLKSYADVDALSGLPTGTPNLLAHIPALA
ncbi:serine protease [Flagelloscypha sp. PMI_526]|nr:serine protease [Flagelloscypha sp. PMI_526]